MRRTEALPRGAGDAAEGFWYAVKRRLLGPPLINQQLAEQRLSKPLALGVLSCDGISSAAYGTEEMLIELLPAFGIAGFALILPMTGVVLLGIVLVVLLYREVVSVYTRAGGSYVVARENFGPRVAQVAAVALLIDYIVTVAVQVAAGSAAIVSAFPALGADGVTLISVLAILLMCYGNLRGIREAGRTFALPTYLFSGAVAIMIVTGLYRQAAGGGLPMAHPAPPGTHGTYPIGHHAGGLLAFGAIYILARAFANGGSSLTGIEAVSNAVSALRPPEGRNAREILVIQGSIVAFLIAGISWMAHVTHATPYQSGFPTVLAQEADLIFGHGVLGRVLFFGVQAGTAAILFTGGNTSFSGFPFLASFVAEDSFLPRWLTKRGHRLVFSSGIIALTVISLTLGLAVGFNVNHLIPFYAIGVFTGFSMAGFGMARYHRQHQGPGWRRHRAISVTGAVYTALVVLIFAVVKFTEGAWLVVIVFPVMVYALIRLNREYRMEARVLEGIGSRPKPPDPPTYSRRTVFVFVDDFDLATVAALRYARSLRPTTLRAVHFVIDNVQADTLRQDWVRANTGITLDFIDCADRRLTHCAAELVSAEAELPGVGVTVILPRRSYSALLGRLLHDRTADRIAGAVSRIPHAAATIVPFDVRSRLEAIEERQAGGVKEPTAPEPVSAKVAGQAAAREQAAGPGQAGAAEPADGEDVADAAALANAEVAVADAVAADAAPAGDGSQYSRPVPPPGIQPMGSLTRPGKATVEGRVYAVEIRPVERNTVLAAEVADSTGHLTALFYGRSHIPGLICGSRVRFRGQVGLQAGGPVMINPAYELVAPGDAGPPDTGPAGGDDSPPRRRGGSRRRKNT
jgi:amino acid transporter